jgi:hypothetical protein
MACFLFTIPTNLTDLVQNSRLQNQNNILTFAVGAKLCMKMKTNALILLGVFLLLGSVAFAAFPPPPPPSNGPPCWPPPCIPIDGGITLLMAAGAAYGAKKLYNSRKKESAD